ncbi:MAG: VOC family protein [Pseudanabaena sp.]|jgi:predicted enzyme related to lactoylglutathione lyase
MAERSSAIFWVLNCPIYLLRCYNLQVFTSEKHMKNPVGYFEVPVVDLDQAILFYEAIFGYSLERVSIDGNEMALFPFDEMASGITGALAQGESYIPSKLGSRVYFNVSEIDSILEKVISLGGKVLYPKTSIGELGWVAEFEDTEGNCIALHSQ